jgi:hypothetical protein
MLYSLKGRLGRALFASGCRALLDTPPVALCAESQFALLSQIRHSDLLMYLLAVKSFCRWLSPAAIYILDDGSLNGDDREILRKHVPGHRLLEIVDFRSEACPKGGTWERLLAISSKVADHYVIQLDADTVATGPLEEVRACVQHGRAFSIATWDDQRPETMRERWEVASRLAREPHAHVQVVAEAHLDRLEGFETMRYIRGCSGFAGFPQGSFSRENVEHISRQMSRALGDRWREWGTEQFTSNVIVANTPDPAVLPHPKYCDCTQLRGEPVFVHFIGTCRFSNGTYRRFGGEAIRALRRSPGTSNT